MLVVEFSEPVVWTQGGFDVDLGITVDGGVMSECGTTGTTVFFGGLTPGSSRFSYSEQLPYRPTGCDFTINEELIRDTDTNDGPDLLVGGGASFHFPGVVWP